MTKQIKIGISNCLVDISYEKRDDVNEGLYTHDLILEFSNYTDAAFSNKISIHCVDRESLLKISEIFKKLALESK